MGQNKIILTSDGNGYLSVENSNADAGETIQLAAIADDGCQLERVEAIDPSTLEISSDLTFTMPNQDVTIRYIYENSGEVFPCVVDYIDTDSLDETSSTPQSKGLAVCSYFFSS